MMLGNNEKARQSLEKAAHLEPAKEETHFWLGKVCLSLGDMESARKEYEILDKMGSQWAQRLKTALE